MKQEEFDQLIHKHFADDVVNPPAHIEEAVFKTLDASARKRKYFGWLISLSIMGFTAIGAWQFTGQTEPEKSMGSSDAIPVVRDNASNDPLNGQLNGPSEVDASLGLIDGAEKALDATEIPIVASQSSSNADPSGLAGGVQGQILAPESTLESISLLPVETIESNALNNAAELEQKREETWMLPAKVKVKH